MKLGKSCYLLRECGFSINNWRLSKHFVGRLAMAGLNKAESVFYAFPIWDRAMIFGSNCALIWLFVGLGAFSCALGASAVVEWSGFSFASVSEGVVAKTWLKGKGRCSCEQRPFDWVRDGVRR